MEIKNFSMNHIHDVQMLLGNCTPYVVPYHPYAYWIIGEYFPSLCLIARENENISGFACGLHSVERGSIFIWQLAVASLCRRKGIAEMLCEEFVKYALENNISSLQTTITDTNTASIAFFTKFCVKRGKTFKKIILPSLNYFENESAYMIKL